MSVTLSFPDHNEDPKKKGEAWILQFAKAVWNNWDMGMATNSIFAKKADRYAEIRAYAMGMQSVNKYKKQLLPDDEQDESWTKIDWTPPANGMVLRNIAVAKLQKAGYNILATAINPQAKDAQDEEYAKAKVKIMMRQALEQNAPQLAQDASVKRLPGEAEDLDELKMEIDHNPKFIRSKDIEESVQLVFYENEANKLWDAISEDIVDFGVGIFRDDLDENNKVVLRYVYPGAFGCSPSKRSDFSDITWAFTVEPVKLSDLSKYFDEKEIDELKNKVAGKNGNPRGFGDNSSDNNGYDIFKADVMTLEFISYNKRVTEEKKDKNGNLRINKTKPSMEGKVDGESTFKAKTYEVIYKCKWVVGTDLIYNFGLAENTKRTASIATMGKTKLSFHIQAASFFNMKATGLTEAMIPTIDDLCMATYKIRNFRNEMVPNGFDIDIAAIEAVAMGKGGEVMSKQDVLNLFFQKGILISRRSGISMDQNVNYKAINPIVNSMAEQIAGLYADKDNSKQALRDITGLNELTDGSTPGERTGKTIANLANESTNNALWYLVNCRKNLIESAAKAVVQRLQVALKRGPYDGFNKAAGRWVNVPKSISDYDYDIMIEDRPSDEQKAIVYQMMQQDIAQGFLSTADVITIINNTNIKDAQIQLSYRAERNKQKMQANSIQNTQATAQAQMESNAAAEKLKDEMAEKEKNRIIEIDNNKKSWDYMIAKLKVEQAEGAVTLKAVQDILGQSIAAGLPLEQLPMQQEMPQQEQAQPMQEPMQQEMAAQ